MTALDAFLSDLEARARASDASLDDIDPFWLKPGEAALVGDMREANKLIRLLVAVAREAKDVPRRLRQRDVSDQEALEFLVETLAALENHAAEVRL